MRPKRWYAIILFCLAMSMLDSDTCPAGRPLEILDHGVFCTSSSREALFKLVFNREADFESVDSEKRLADSFQFFLSTAGQCSLHDFYEAAAGEKSPAAMFVVRSEGLNEGNMVVVRSIAPLQQKQKVQTSGGWGPVVARSSCKQRGRFIIFALDLGAIEAGCDCNALYYYVEAYQYGMWNRQTLKGRAVVRHHGKRGP